MEVKGAWGLVTGGLCAWRLPGDESRPATARRLVRQTMSELRLDRDVIEDGELAVSETATNALRHAGHAQGDRPPTIPELWIWARTVPSPQLIVSVFDGARTAAPHTSGAGLLDEHGKGLELVRQVTAAWGSTPTRSRVDTTSTLGKRVWFALPLPHDWPGLHYRVHPGTAAHHLLLNLTRRGFKGQRNTTEDGLSVLVFPTLNVWVHRRTFCWWSTPHRYLRRPLIDLQETTELLTHHLDTTHAPACSPLP
ncbi:ATP-binding protein [Actinomadura sp. BRA 177]|uniref:ATP-binding protein n=1 Tax=Actinomadura sp. BRA 177 TaxID=2745202 RepID=UPI0015951555|nr:ATP-binding protein [Actinomadura sp. BRA 177]NVI91234.1 ATP-binding protein [Actinomadura sp. BRA 177]